MAGLKITCIGEAMVEITLAEAAAPLGFAGDTLNTAIYLRRCLGSEHEVSFVTVLGSDPVSDQMIRFIADQGISTGRILRHRERLPGIYAIATGENGERSFLYWRENSAARCLFQGGFDVLDGVDVIYFSAITLAILPEDRRSDFLKWLEGWGGLVAFDSNYRPRLWETSDTARRAVEWAWLRADIALPSLEDEIALFGDRDEQAVLRRLRSYGLRKGALKRGEVGPVPIADGSRFNTDFPAAKCVLDTTAAGDSFNGAYLAALLTGRPEEEALAEGHALALKVIAKRGAVV